MTLVQRVRGVVPAPFLLAAVLVASGLTWAVLRGFTGPSAWVIWLVNLLVGVGLVVFLGESWREALRVVGTIVAALLIGLLITVLISNEPLTAYRALLLGPLTRVNRWGNWIEDALTLILVGLAVAIVFRARQFSLGAEGQLYVGALAVGFVGLYLDMPAALHITLALVAAALAGFAWGLIPGALKAYLGANEIVSTLMLNVIAIKLYEGILTFVLKPPDAGYTASGLFVPSALLPRVVTGTRVTIAVAVVALVVLAGWVFMQRTALGYQIRIVGVNQLFARYGGVPTAKTIMLSMAISGAVAGLAGAHLAMAIHQRLILNISLGLGFEGIVVSLLARNNPVVVPFAGLFYAYLRTGAVIMERDADVSFEIVRVIQAIIILLITAQALVRFFARRRARRVEPLEPLAVAAGAGAPAADA